MRFVLAPVVLVGALSVLQQPLTADPIVVFDMPAGYPRATAIRGLQLMGVTFNVTFHPKASYDDVALSDPYFLGNEGAAESARDAVLTALNDALDPDTRVPSVNDDSQASGTERTLFLVPFEIIPNGVRLKTGVADPPDTENYLPSTLGLTRNTAEPFYAYVLFEKQQVSSVPEPASILIWAALLGAAGCMVLWQGRRTRKPLSACG